MQRLGRKGERCLKKVSLCVWWVIAFVCILSVRQATGGVLEEFDCFRVRLTLGAMGITFSRRFRAGIHEVQTSASYPVSSYSTILPPRPPLPLTSSSNLQLRTLASSDLNCLVRVRCCGLGLWLADVRVLEIYARGDGGTVGFDGEVRGD